MEAQPGGETSGAMRDIERRIRDEIERIEQWRASMAKIRIEPKPVPTEADVLAFLEKAIGPSVNRRARSTELSHWVTNDGYMVSAKQFPRKMVLMRSKKGRGAQLIMRLFGPRAPSEFALVHHKNWDRSDCRLENLEWRSSLEINEMRKKLKPRVK